MKKSRFAILALMAMVLSSCSQRLVDFTVISSRNIPITEVGTEFKKSTQRVSGEDVKWSILFVPGVPNMKEAIDRAIEKFPGAVALTDGVIYSKGWSCGLFGQNKYVVEGTPLYTQVGADRYNQAVFGNADYNNNQQQQPSQQPTAAIMVFHEVKPDETMSDIAKTYGCTIGDIIKWNQLSSTSLTTGSKLKIYVK